jgi:head-tail adaptor
MTIFLQAGQLNEPIVFSRRADVADPTGGTTHGDYQPVFTRMAQVRQATGREIIEGGRAADSIDCYIRVREDSDTRTITFSDRAKLREVDFDIITVGLPSYGGSGFIEMTLRRQSGGQ